MAKQVTKKDLEETTSTILEAMNHRFGKIEEHIDHRFGRIEGRMDTFDEKLDKLTTTLDNFLKRLTDFEDEFTIVKQEVRRLKEVVKEKLGVDI